MHHSIADWLADQSHEAQGMADLRGFLNYHASKRKKYLQLLVDINLLILRVLAEDQALREAKFSPDPLKAIHRLKPPLPRTPAKYACPLPDEGFSIDLVPFNEEGLPPLEECILTYQLWLFWKHSRFQVADADEQGSSWLELFAQTCAR